jgi:glycerol-3-phosphate dehydrogenase (NAD(P)+)
LLIVTPSKVVRQTIQQFKKYLTNQQIIICSKGFEEKTLYTLEEVVEEELPGFKIGGLSRTKSCRRSIKRYNNSTCYCIKI